MSTSLCELEKLGVHSNSSKPHYSFITKSRVCFGYKSCSSAVSEPKFHDVRIDTQMSNI